MVQLGVFEAVGPVVRVDQNARDQVERERREVELFPLRDDLELVEVVDLGNVEVSLRLEQMAHEKLGVLGVDEELPVP